MASLGLFNTTIYGHDDRYRGISGDRHVVLVNPDDLRELDLTDGAPVDLVGSWEDGSVRVAPRFRIVAYPTPRGCTASYYPEVNVLVPLDSTAIGSNCPTSKAVMIRLMPVTGESDRPREHNTPGKPLHADDHHKSPVQPHHLS